MRTGTRRPLRALLVLVALLFSPRAPGARFDQGEPVPKTMLQGNRLVVADVGVSIEAPSSAYRFKKSSFPSPMEGAKVPADLYICQNSMNENETPFFFVVVKGNVGALTPEVVDRFVQGLKKGSSGSSMIFARPETRPSGIPWQGSYRFKYELVSARGDGTMFGYIGATKNVLLMTQCVTFDGYEPSAFARFSQSIRASEPAPAPAAASPDTATRSDAAPRDVVAQAAATAAVRAFAIVGGIVAVAVIGLIVAAASRNKHRYAGSVPRSAPRPQAGRPGPGQPTRPPGPPGAPPR